MSVGAIPGSNAGAVNSPASQSQNSDSAAAATFANWLSTVQNPGQTSSSSSKSAAGSGPGLVNLSNPTAAFAAHLSNGLTVGLVALGPVSSAGEQQMADAVEQSALDFAKINIPTASSDDASTDDTSSSSSTDGNPPASGGVGGGIGMYTAMPNGIEFMAWTAGTANGGPSVQDMDDGMNSAVTNLEQAMGVSTGS